MLRSPAALVLLLCVLNNLTGQHPAFEMEALLPDRSFDAPWALVYGPDDWLWVTDRKAAEVVRVDPESGDRDLLLQIPDVATDAGQTGLLGMAHHPDFAGDSNFVYFSYTIRLEGERRQRLVRYTYSLSESDGSLTDPFIILDRLPASNDHNSGRLIFGPDDKLYYSIGDQGGNQNSNYCNPILSQLLPSQEEIDGGDWSHYPGKILRLNPDGSIPVDNPTWDEVRSHVFSIGHRNPQGLVFGPDGRLYSDEHGPDTDDEVNLILGGKNYGWPIVAGFRDDQAYDYCNWSSVSNCSDLDYDKFNCPDGAEFREENTLTDTSYREPLFSLFNVTDEYDFNDPACDNSWVCRPNVAPTSLDIYTSDVIPEWQNSLLVVSIKRGRIYRLKLNEAGTAILGDTTQHFYTRNRYRDMAVGPDGKTFYILTDVSGRVTSRSGLSSFTNYANPGTILRFTLAAPSSVRESPATLPFRVWPNPVTDRLWIESLRTRITTFTASLLDVNGRMLRTWSGEYADNPVFNVADISPGVYLLRIVSEGRVGVRKVIIR